MILPHVTGTCPKCGRDLAPRSTVVVGRNVTVTVPLCPDCNPDHREQLFDGKTESDR